MLIYGSSINNSQHNEKNDLVKQKKLIKYKFENINIEIKYDYAQNNNFYTNGTLTCIYVGQPYYMNKRIDARQIIEMKCKGKNYLKKLTGAFLLILHNSKNDNLTIYRSVLFMDTIYYKIGDIIEFSNNLNNIAIKDIKKISREYINEYLSLPINSYINTTPYKDVYRLIPGQCIEINLAKKNFKIKYLKKINYSSKITKLNETKCASEYYKLFEESVKDLLLNSNKKIRIYASGGLDSSAIIYVIHKLIEKEKLDKDVLLIHKKYKNDDLENNYLEDLNKLTKFKINYEEVLENTIFNNIDIKQSIGVCEPTIELLTNTNSNNNMIQEDVTIFSGYGGDQLLYANLIDETGNKLEKIFSMINSKSILLNKLNYICCQHLKDKIINMQYLKKYDIISKRKEKLLTFGHKNPYKTVKFSNYYLLYPYNINSSFDIKYPFCDERLIDFCFNMNYKYYYNDVTKYIFRKAFCNKLPKSIIERKDKTATYNTFNLTIKKYEENIWKIFENSILVKENIFDKEKYRSSIYKFINASMIDFIGFLNILALDYWLILQYNLGGQICD